MRVMVTFGAIVVNQRVRSPEQLRKPETETRERPMLPSWGQDRLRVMPNPALPGSDTLKTVGNTSTVLPSNVNETAPVGTFRAGHLQRVDALRSQALGSTGAVRRFDESLGAPYYAALSSARELDAARRGHDINRVMRTLEGKSGEEIQNIRLVWKTKLGPESLDVALRSAFPQDADKVARLLRGVLKRT